MRVATQFGDDVAGTITARADSSPCVDRGMNVVVIEGGGEGLRESYVLKVRGGSRTYVKMDGKVGTAGKGSLVGRDVAFTVAAVQDQTLFQPVDFRAGNVGSEADPAGTICSKGSGGYSLNYQPGVMESGDGMDYVVRRLTPTETERLMGFPDGHTDITGCDVDAVTSKVAASLAYDEGQTAALRRRVAKWSRDCPDTKRYKACGNSFATNVITWIGDRIQRVQDVVDDLGLDDGFHEEGEEDWSDC